MKEQEEEYFKSIKLMLNYYDEEGKHSTKLTTIKVSKPKGSTEKYFSLETKLKYSIRYSIVLPDHIHKYLIGKSVPVTVYNNEHHDKNAQRTFDRNLPKTISFESLEMVCDQYWNHLQAYRWLKRLEYAKLDKVIFYNFENSTDEYTSDWNRIYLGQKSKLRYVYGIGYVSHTDDNVYRYNKDKRLLSTSHEPEFFKCKWIDWTEARQQFFDNIQKSFETIIDRINDFESKIDDSTIDAIINSKTKLLS